MDPAGVEKDPLGERRLAGVDVSRDPNVTDERRQLAPLILVLLDAGSGGETAEAGGGRGLVEEEERKEAGAGAGGFG